MNLLTRGKAQAILGRSESTLKRLEDRGQLRRFEVAGVRGVRYLDTDVLALVGLAPQPTAAEGPPPAPEIPNQPTQRGRRPSGEPLLNVLPPKKKRGGQA